MKNRIVFIFLLFLLNAYSQLFTFRNFNHKNGLNLSSVSAIAQDQYGAIWLGTDGAGLQRFDGYKITTPNESISENEHHVTSIDPIENEIYFTSRYKGIYRFFKGKYEKLAIYQKRVGDYLAVKKTTHGILIVGSKKIRFIGKNDKSKEVYWKNIVTNLVQFQEVNGLVFILSENESFVLNNTTIIPVSEWLNLKESVRFSFLSAFKNKINLYSRDHSTRYTVYLDKENNITKIQEKNILFPKIETIKHVYSKYNKLIILDSSDNIFYSFHHKIKFLPKNYYNQQLSLDKVFIDKNNDFWGVSNSQGFFKISEEPFTKIELHKVYQNPLISFIYKSKYNEVFLSDFNSKSYVSSFQKSSFIEYDFRIYAQTEYQGQQLFATNIGLLKYQNGQFSKFKTISGKIIFVLAVEKTLFYGLEKEGLYKYENGKSYHINDCNASHVYTAQLNSFKTKVFFGTNDGIYEYRLADNHVKYLSSKFKVRTRYSGVSTVDSYGTIWFTLDKSLLGITQQGQVKLINNPMYFSSTLFYTLSSDSFGNIWVGTNNGITRLKLDNKGNVLTYKSFNKENGFDGYETHMRSCFQDQNAIFVGTIEGLFMLNPANIEKSNSPPKPYIYQTTVKNSKYSVYDEDLIKLNFIAINPKNLGVHYTYRLRGKNNKWSTLSPNTSAYFANLSDQNYVFEVKSSYDGLSFSEPSTYKINISIPFWKSTWFILILIISIAIGNFFILDRSKTFNIDRNIELNNFNISAKMTSYILIFGIIAIALTYFFAPKLDTTIPNMFIANIILIVFILALIVIARSKKNIFGLKEEVLKLAFYAMVVHTFFGAYLSNLHPFFLIVICLCSSLTNMILQTINNVIIYVILQFLATCTLVFVLDQTIYNEILFLIAMIVSIMISLFNTYVKNESLQKLMFTSTLLNNAHFFVVVYNENEEITYVNDSFSSTFLTKSMSFLNHHINQFKQLIFNSLDTTNNFGNAFGRKEQVILPMKSKEGALIWIKWKTKIFSKNRKVLFGVDVSEKIRAKQDYQKLFNCTDYLFFFTDINGRVKEYNKQFHQFFESSEVSLMDKETTDYLFEEDSEDVKQYYQNQFLNKIEKTHYCFRVYNHKGEVRWLEQFTELVYEKESSKFIKGFFCYAKDVTELKTLKENLSDISHKQRSDYSNISYLQTSLIPDREKLTKLFPKNYVFERLKNTVSTNFYWADKINEYKIFVFSTCQSEGIVSSILSSYGSLILKNCIELSVNYDPSELLIDFEHQVKKQFANYIENHFNLKFELTIVVFDELTNKIKYASSGGRFISIYKKEVLVHKGESKKIAEELTIRFKSYNTYELLHNKIDYLVFFTDGIINQLNPVLNKPFTLKRFLDHFKNPEYITLKEKMNQLEKLVDEWKSEASQEDDILVIAFKI